MIIELISLEVPFIAIFYEIKYLKIQIKFP